MIMKQDAIKIFEDQAVRAAWDDEQQKWYVSIIDVVKILTDSADPTAYWRKLKQRLKAEGNQTVTNCHGLKMRALDGKMRITDVADTRQLFRLIQSIPSPKAEPFKLWLAKIAEERLDEMQDPELTIDRALEQYLQLGYSENWINQDISQAVNPETFEESKKVAQQGGKVAKVARLELEARTGKKVVTALNAKTTLQLKSDTDSNTE
jgi:hypothetical protein